MNVLWKKNLICALQGVGNSATNKAQSQTLQNVRELSDEAVFRLGQLYVRRHQCNSTMSTESPAVQLMLV